MLSLKEILFVSRVFDAMLFHLQRVSGQIASVVSVVLQAVPL